MTDGVYRGIIIDTVTNKPAIKNVELALSIMDVIGPGKFDQELFYESLAQLIDEGEILELEFQTPLIDYRVKSLYFAKGSSFNFNTRTK